MKQTTSQDLLRLFTEERQSLVIDASIASLKKSIQEVKFVITSTDVQCKLEDVCKPGHFAAALALIQVVSKFATVRQAIQDLSGS